MDKSDKIISQISDLTKIDESAVRCILSTYEVLALNEILKLRTDESINVDNIKSVDLGIISLDVNDITNITARLSDDFKNKVVDVNLNNRDYLSESVIHKFDEALLLRYYSESLVSESDNDD
jgi:hypothetical protein